MKSINHFIKSFILVMLLSSCENSLQKDAEKFADIQCKQQQLLVKYTEDTKAAATDASATMNLMNKYTAESAQIASELKLWKEEVEKKYSDKKDRAELMQLTEKQMEKCNNMVIQNISATSMATEKSAAVPVVNKAPVNTKDYQLYLATYSNYVDGEGEAYYKFFEKEGQLSATYQATIGNETPVEVQLDASTGLCTLIYKDFGGNSKRIRAKFMADGKGHYNLVEQEQHGSTYVYSK